MVCFLPVGYSVRLTFRALALCQSRLRDCGEIHDMNSLLSLIHVYLAWFYSQDPSGYPSLYPFDFGLE